MYSQISDIVKYQHGIAIFLRKYVCVLKKLQEMNFSLCVECTLIHEHCIFKFFLHEKNCSFLKRFILGCRLPTAYVSIKLSYVKKCFMIALTSENDTPSMYLSNGTIF